MRSQDLIVAYATQPTLTGVVTAIDPVLGILPYPLNGLQGQFLIKHQATDLDSAAIASLTTAGGQINWVDAPNGRYTVSISAVCTAMKGQFAYHFDLINGLRAVTVLNGLWIVEAV